MSRALIFCAGGHGCVVVDAMRAALAVGAGRWEPVAFVDENPLIVGTTLMNLPVGQMGGDLPPHDGVIVTIGDNRRRADTWVRLQEEGFEFASAIHPSAVIAPDVEIGRGVMVCAGAIVNTGSQIGDNVILNTACSIDHHNNIGSHTHIGPGAHLGGTVDVGEGAFVGLGSCVIPGRSLGSWSVVGAGAVVTNEVAAGTVVLGVPARTRA